MDEGEGEEEGCGTCCKRAELGTHGEGEGTARDEESAPAPTSWMARVERNCGWAQPSTRPKIQFARTRRPTMAAQSAAASAPFARVDVVLVDVLRSWTRKRFAAARASDESDG